ncbi:aldehyde dehydrogenase [Nocardioides pocheonensis]|uniref:Aldehyde dehydrogenase n=1 Tax=Nocardioides pocheonensis TaxID=661485 RepID=A0A3N0GJ23_9ACTN|nr:aldehyde dehydrogenase [Nocardioides pocheonensis]RNM12172.1 aldehyde dehydrogenase [Nocardioides pocheonensis]
MDAVIENQYLFIGGEWIAPASDERISVFSPTTEALVGTTPAASEADVDRAVAAAVAVHAAGDWRQLAVAERGEYLMRFSAELQPHLDEIVQLQIDEMGGPDKWIRATTAGRIEAASKYVADALTIPPRETRDGSSGKVLVDRQPVGVTASVIPWNGPIATALGKIYAALIAGCPLILKPAPETPLSASFLADAAVRSGIPSGVLSILPGGREVSEYLISRNGVSRVAFTGSTAAGRRVAALCGERLARVSVELGGKSAAIVLDDVDLDAMMPHLIASSLPNTGQVCHATTRLLIPRKRAAEVTERLVEAVAALVVGDPHDPETDIGPLVAERQRDRVEQYIALGKSEGATLLYGGGRPQGERGWFVQPTIFGGVENSMTIARDEIFGPVLTLTAYDTVDQAVAFANDSDYGLGGAVFTSDEERGLEVALRLETGSCRINESPGGGGGGPFGGVKQSGFGRENGREGIESYYELKSIALPGGLVNNLRSSEDLTT